MVVMVAVVLLSNITVNKMNKLVFENVELNNNEIS